MNAQIQRHKANLRDISQNQVKAKRLKHEEETKDLPVRQALPKFKKVRKEFLIKDHDFNGKEYLFELLYYKYGRTDQYLVRVNSKQLYYNRRGRIVLNQTAKPVVMGLHAAHKLAMSKFHRIRRLY
ncbi:hypothetical protein KAR91_58275 [Candidatus Pacearchaeota archaeon]|nr:hypothetical protein [Candidatus Pacearchaeota archaeon]